jgi:serine protease Do
MTRRFLPLVLALSLLAACGDDNAVITTTSTSSGASTTVTSEAGSSTTAGSTTGAVNDLEGVRDAVVQIVAEGSFVDPGTGAQATVAGAGSGFIIDPSGLAVTNNHVVTGAALLKVYVNGMDGPQNAHVVAVSECSDLAVIDINGDGFSYLDWYDGPVTTGLSIYVAGYPLGDPEYTLLDGIVSKERVDGETSWSSVDSVIEHSADTLPGNSGGPLVTADGKVVGVNYASNQAGQSFAIGLDVAKPVVDQLMTGTNLETIGVNGEALSIDGFDGIWVYSVAGGSPADDAGIKGGDLITSLAGFPVGTDGTMSDYCDILRSHTATDVVDVEVYRASTQEVLDGQLNGRTLEVVTSFAVDLGSDVPDNGGPADYTDYTTVTDDSGSIEVSVPVEWSDVVGPPWNQGGADLGPSLTAAPDVDAWQSTWGTPGVFIGASATLGQTPSQMLDDLSFTECDYVDRSDYDDGLYVGLFDYYENCGAEGSTFIVVAAQPPDGSFDILVEIVAVDDRDLTAADQVSATFVVNLAG